MLRPAAFILSLALTINLPVTPAAQQTAVPVSGDSSVSGTRIRADVEFLADDLLEGRETATRGYDLAARYVASMLKAAGYAPGADDGTYFQQVPLVESTPTATAMRLTVNGKTTEVSVPDQGIVSPSAVRATAEVTAPVVFAGFGVTAPDFEYDDYAALDVTGKIVAILSNAPGTFPSEPRAHFASNEHKLKNAADHGAVAVVTVLGPDDLKRFPWEQAKASAARPTLTWANADGTPGPIEKRLKAVGYLSPQGSARLFEGSTITFDQAVEAGRKGVPGGAALSATLTMTSATSHKRMSSPNVVGVLRGSEPALAATSVVLTAHLDHTGVKPSGDGDRINNGAYDNATGSAIVLEVARGLASQAARPKRTVVVVLVTAEEKGLLGSDYFAHNPVKAAGRMVANVNLDMPLFMTASRDIAAFGSENSTLDAVVRKAVAETGYTLSPDPMPEQNIFVRSDQYSLVKQGVPAVYLMPGFTATDPSVNGQQVFGGFLASHYHKPSDDLSLPMDLAAVERFTRANLAVARAIADDPVDPAWKPGNFFGKVFGKSKRAPTSRR
jgi:Zn-dependent M28 family amino/carboxypeptidase